MDIKITQRSYLVAGQAKTAIWSGYFLVFPKELGGQLVRHERTLFVLGPFVLFWCYSCVYNTNEAAKVLFTDSVSTTAVLDPLIRILSTPSKILCVLLVTTTLLHTIK